MREHITLLLIIFLFFAGCTSYMSNLTAPKNILALNQTAIFDSNEQQFTISIDRVAMSSPSNDNHRITVHITAKNLGKKAFSLVAYPRLNDASGKEYNGNSIFLNSLNPGGQSSGESSITIDSKEDYAALEKGAVLSVRLQGGPGKVWEADWIVDVASLP